MIDYARTLTAVLAFATVGGMAQAAPPYYDHWQVFSVADGLPSEKVLCVCAGEDEVWVGTDRGLARYHQGRWQTYTPADGLAHEAIMSLAIDPDTGDTWIGTLRGLNRYSAGRFDTFTQFNSGLSNDVVYGVTARHGEVWAATAAGASRYELATGRWTIYNESNTPMHEIWCYSVTGCGDKTYLAVWGGGLLEYDSKSDRWKDYRDPDGEMEIDLFRNDGLIHDVVASVACDESSATKPGLVWIGTYFGLSTYDGRKWLNFMDHDSPQLAAAPDGQLISNFINFVATHAGTGWIATDNGLNATDRKNWWSYRRDERTGQGIVTYSRQLTADSFQLQRFTTDTIFPHNYILGISFQGDDIWVATEKGVARGTSTGRTTARTKDKTPAKQVRQP